MDNLFHYGSLFIAIVCMYGTIHFLILVIYSHTLEFLNTRKTTKTLSLYEIKTKILSSDKISYNHKKKDLINILDEIWYK